MTWAVLIERLHVMSQHSNSLATATAAIFVHNENLLRLCTKMAAVSLEKLRMHTNALYQKLIGVAMVLNYITYFNFHSKQVIAIFILTNPPDDGSDIHL